MKARTLKTSKSLDHQSQFKSSMFDFFNQKCRKNSVFCNFLLKTEILEKVVEESKLTELRQMVYYYLQPGRSPE